MKRRDALRSLSLAGGASLLASGRTLAEAMSPAPNAAYTQAVKGTAPVKIRNINTVLTAPNRIRLVIVKVETTEPGLVGWGCATFTQRALVVQTAIEQYLKPFLIGRNVDEIEDIWQSSYVSSYWRNGPVLFNAMSGVDIALWDIKGKRAGMPVYQLLGGKVRQGADCYFHASGSEFHGSRRQRAQGDGAGLPARPRAGGRRRGYAGYGAGGAARPAAGAADEVVGPTNPKAIWESAPYVRMVPKLFEHLRTKLGDEVELLHDVHERVTLQRGDQPVQGARAVPPVLPRGPVSAGGERPLPAAAPADQHPDRDGRAVQHPARVRAAHQGTADRLHPHPHLADRRPESRRARWRRCASSSASAPPGTAPATRRRSRTRRSSRWSCRSTTSASTKAAGFPKETQEVFVGCPEVKNGYMLAQEKPGLGIDVDEKLAAKFPVPAGAAELRLLVGHDAAQGRDGHPSLISIPRQNRYRIDSVRREDCFLARRPKGTA